MEQSEDALGSHGTWTARCRCMTLKESGHSTHITVNAFSFLKSMCSVQKLDSHHPKRTKQEQNFASLWVTVSLPWEPNALRANPGFYPLKENQTRIKAFTAHASQWAHAALTDSSLCMHIQRKQLLKQYNPVILTGALLHIFRYWSRWGRSPIASLSDAALKFHFKKKINLQYFLPACKTKDWSLTVLYVH